MLVLRYVLPALLMPTMLTLVLVTTGMLWRRRALVWAGVIVLWVASTPLVSDVMMRGVESWAVARRAADAPRVDAIVVLSMSRVQAPGMATIYQWEDANRFFGGIELMRNGKAPLLVFTGGWSPFEPTLPLFGAVSAQRAVDLGIPKDRIAVTARVGTTEDEAAAVHQLLRERHRALSNGAVQRSSVLLVTSAFHMRRARMLFERAGLTTIPFPVDFRVSAAHPWSITDLLPEAGSLGQSELALHEVYGQLFYMTLAR